MGRIVFNVLKTWLVLALVITFAAMLVYVSVQQTLRQSANDPQIQMAEDAADALAAGQPVDSVVPSRQVDIARSLAPYVIVFDDSRQVLASSAVLHGRVPSVPVGVLDYVRRRGEDRITWQPEPGVRSAAVVARVGGTRPGFVLAGRSLREVEAREDQLTALCGLAWIAALAAALLVVTALELISTRLGSYIHPA